MHKILRDVGMILAIVIVGRATPLHSQPQPRTITGMVVSVHDGDTIRVYDGNKRISIRLHGIDCPEMGQDFSRRAKQAAADAVFGKTVRILDHGPDRYGRTIGVVMTSGGGNLNEMLVRDGLCWWYRQYAPNDSRLRQFEEQARAAQIGLWSHPAPIPPWEWRRGKRAGGTTGNGRIIGNRRSKIYHYPDCPSYSAVSPRNAVHFDSGDDARKSGFRPAKNCRR
jgi:micrococcal nuclease